MLFAKKCGDLACKHEDLPSKKMESTKNAAIKPVRTKHRLHYIALYCITCYEVAHEYAI